MPTPGSTSRSSIELVDRLDRKYQKVSGTKSDLILQVEDRDGVVRATDDDYVGLEMDLQIIERNRKKKRRNRILLAALALTLSILIVTGVSYYYKPSESPAKNAPVHNPPHPHSPPSPPVSKPPTTTSSTTTLPPSSGNKKPTSTAPAPAVDSSSLWPTRAPLPPFDICPPPLKHRPTSAIYKLSKIDIVPEAPNEDDDVESWEFTFSDLDISEEASIVAVGLEDFSHSNFSIWEVGMVRVFAWSCDDKKWKQLGQDLLGENEWEQFGHAVSSSNDGKTMAVSAPQQDYDGGIGFVQVYYLDEEDSPHAWLPLGSRIENLNDTMTDYYNLGHAIDLSSSGETLAVLAITDEQSTEFVARVFDYDYNAKEWVRKGHDISIKINYPDDLDFDPQLTLNDDGDELSMADPELGIVTYKFHFQRDKWMQSHDKTLKLDEDDTYWIESMDMDNAATVVGYSAFVVDGASTVKLYDYTSDTQSVVLYNRTYEDEAVDICLAISKNGKVSAVVASKDDEDDQNFWWDDYVGTMTVVALNETTNKWTVVGNGTHSANLGVPGDYVTLSGDGQIAAVGSSTIVQLYGIALKNAVVAGNNTASNNSPSSTTSETFQVCPPFPDAEPNDHVGDLDQLPKQEEEHTLSLATSDDGSIVAVGIDFFENENRGLARVFAWDCASQSFLQRGQDLYGSDDFDGFGQSVDLSSDGNTLAVGANQPPPGKSGYVDVYNFMDGEWKLVGHRLDNVKNTIEDVGRQVRISKDGNIVMFSGSILEEAEGGYTASFIRVMQNVDGEWKNKGDDLVSSIDYDDYGTEVRISMSGDGQTLGVTGSYSSFTAKIYTYNTHKKNWTEAVIPPMMASNDTVSDWDYDYESYWDGDDISLNDDGTVVAVAGTTFWDEDNANGAAVRVLNYTKGKWSLSHDVIDYTQDYAASSVAISGDGTTLAVGINAHGEDGLTDQGALFVTTGDNSDLGWNSLGKIDGRQRNDLLGSRVTISKNGQLAAASSRKGYIVFFKVGG